MEAVVLDRMPLILVGDGHIGLAIENDVDDERGGSMGQTLKFFLGNGEKDVVLNSGTIKVARDEALAAESLDNGLVALLANLAIQRKMLHFNKS